ncbi:alpha/beta hydrolase [Micromonospora sp. NBC_00362]|uniref:alpha/beta hydrolase n=1 Tax=Micromonospora sp. NBC_00362 TaxID=2975975 RepID=UPI00224F5252|nr:alpha/beta hydrolase [Micromonospora sp. NBC_00362]MCX5122089.1 alpha/beta hydrolase [Micromonospora sp. NBC_00362]
MKRSIAVGLVLAAAAAATGFAGAASAAPASLEFGACPADVNVPGLQCSTVRVPVDYGNPSAGSVDIAVSRLAATNPSARRGVLLANPGGPGGVGLDWVPGRWATRLPAEVRARYDIIGFDPRGVGHSRAIQCVQPPYDFWSPPLPDPDLAANRELNFERSAQYAQACAANGTKLLSQATTANMARDMDAIRAALGEQKISYVGYSAGTYLGAVYSELFASRVDRMILDSNIDPAPDDVWYQYNLNQAKAGGPRFNAYLDWLAAHHGTFGLGSSRSQVRAAWDGALAELQASPRGPLGPYEFIEATFNVLYHELWWSDFGHPIADFVLRGDAAGLQGWAGDRRNVQFENQYAVYSAVTCQDAPTPRDRAKITADAQALENQTPFAWYVQFFSACYDWRLPVRQPVKIHGIGVPPILMFNSANDMVTPIEGAVSLHRALPGSVLVTEQNSGRHGVSYQPGINNPEANRIANEYLLNGTLPTSDVTIPGHALPTPSAG